MKSRNFQIGESNPKIFKISAIELNENADMTVFLTYFKEGCGANENAWISLKKKDKNEKKGKN